MKTTAFGIALLFAAALLTTCGDEKEGPGMDLAGNWLIVYSDHQLTSAQQREVYGRYQDSMISLYGLKLVTLAPDGGFREMDSLYKPAGKWLFTPDSLLKIREAGRGFNPFNTAYAGFKNNELLLTQYLALESQRIKIVWHLKRLAPDSTAERLFSNEGNAWRKRPSSPESKPAMKKRLVAMLNYYADYFALVEKEASYFAPSRVPLPFRYYQHAVGLKEEIPPAFANLFYSPQQAAEAYQLLSEGVTGLKGRFPYADNFVKEYGLFLKKLANWMGYELPGALSGFSGLFFFTFPALPAALKRCGAKELV